MTKLFFIITQIATALTYIYNFTIVRPTLTYKKYQHVHSSIQHTQVRLRAHTHTHTHTHTQTQTHTHTKTHTQTQCTLF